MVEIVGVLNEEPVPKTLVPTESLYHVMVPPLAVACKFTEPVPQREFGITEVIVLELLTGNEYKEKPGKLVPAAKTLPLPAIAVAAIPTTEVEYNPPSLVLAVPTNVGLAKLFIL